jgi:hypothetical protein
MLPQPHATLIRSHATRRHKMRTHPAASVHRLSGRVPLSVTVLNCGRNGNIPRLPAATTNPSSGRNGNALRQLALARDPYPGKNGNTSPATGAASGPCRGDACIARPNLIATLAIHGRFGASASRSRSPQTGIPAETATPHAGRAEASTGRPSAGTRSPARTAIPLAHRSAPPAHDHPYGFSLLRPPATHAAHRSEIPAKTAILLVLRRGTRLTSPLAPQGEGPGVRPSIPARTAIPNLLLTLRRLCVFCALCVERNPLAARLCPRCYTTCSLRGYAPAR